MNQTLDLAALLTNVDRIRERNCFAKSFGLSQKAEDAQKAIHELNAKYNTDYYLEREGKSLFIAGHREYGPISRRNGILGHDVSLTIDISKLVKAGSEHTIKMIIDNNSHWMVVSLSKMKDMGLLNIDGGRRLRSVRGKIARFCVWEFPEIENAILYSS